MGRVPIFVTPTETTSAPPAPELSARARCPCPHDTRIVATKAIETPDSGSMFFANGIFKVRSWAVGISRAFHRDALHLGGQLLQREPVGAAVRNELLLVKPDLS